MPKQENCLKVTRARKNSKSITRINLEQSIRGANLLGASWIEVEIETDIAVCKDNRFSAVPS